MTDEDKKLIAGYMGWQLPCDGNTNNAAICAIEDGSLCVKCEFHHPFDLNDAGLVVEEMVKRDDWLSFITFADNEHFDKEISAEFSAWLFNADNFFEAFVEWRKGRP